MVYQNLKKIIFPKWQIFPKPCLIFSAWEAFAAAELGRGRHPLVGSVDSTTSALCSQLHPPLQWLDLWPRLQKNNTYHIDCPPSPSQGLPSPAVYSHCVFKKCFSHFPACLLPGAFSFFPWDRKRGVGGDATVLRSHSFRPAPRKSRYFQVDWKFNFAIFFLFFKEIQRDVARVSALLLNKLHVFLTYAKKLCLHCAWVSVVQLWTCAWWDLEDFVPTVTFRTSPLQRRHHLSKTHPSLGQLLLVVRK